MVYDPFSFLLSNIEAARELTYFSQAPSLAPRGKRPTVSLPLVRKKQRTEGTPGETGVLAPLQVGQANVEGSVTQQSGSRSSRERTAAGQGHHTPARAAGASTAVVGGASSHSSRPLGSFIKADPNIRLSLVQDIIKSWDLAAPGDSYPPPVSGEEIGMVEAFARGMKAVAECRCLEGLVSSTNGITRG